MCTPNPRQDHNNRRPAAPDRQAVDPLEEVEPDEDDPTQIPDNQHGPRARAAQ